MKYIITTGYVLLCLLASTVFAQTVAHKGERINLADTAQCLSCHKEMEAHSHPVMVDYPPTGKESRYAPAERLNERGLQLRQGKVVCTTCHDLENENPNFLVIADSKTRLCTACHSRL